VWAVRIADAAAPPHGGAVTLALAVHSIRRGAALALRLAHRPAKEVYITSRTLQRLITSAACRIGQRLTGHKFHSAEAVSP
jgi:hypothetical protein